MNAFETYKTYLALKHHFTRDSYDYHKYNGKVNASVKSFESRKDRFYFDKLSKHRDPTSFMLANILEDTGVWVGELVNGESSDSRYTNWLRRTQSLTYNFKTELDRLDEDFDANFRSANGRHPPLLQLFLRKEVSLETLVILVHMTGCMRLWDKLMDYDPVWKETRMKIVKYQPFMKYDLKKLKKIVMDKFSD